MSNNLVGSWLPTKLQALHHGSGSVEKHLISSLPSEKSKAFIVTGSSLATKTDLIKKVEALLTDHHVSTFAKIRQHAPVAEIDEATEIVLKDSSVDTVISIGGGSPIDAAKAISHRVHEKTGKFLTHITIPTTISAAECTKNAGYTGDDGLKISVSAPELYPQVILYDSSFAIKTPPHLWTSTGMRAMDHAVETMYHPDASELDRMIVLQAASKLFTYLPIYHKNPKDEDAITQLQLAAFASLGFIGQGMKSPLGLSHTLGYALGSPYGIPHGITSCITLGHVAKLKSHDPAAAEQLARMAPFVGAKVTGTAQIDASAVGDRVLELVEELGLTTRLSDKGVGDDQVPIIVKRATKQESGPVFDKVAEIVKAMF
ncbi:Dehydroquinate synthase-like protein [Microthyrium microscopicum]|uniref:Dehydroquinate synthase-like protein n=1 Tax=Microthyrium microscopicum TaxID=703497 RepID=A0A6A6UR80_9PEZI|nr:Dehydroquinate synthase-like protein [Microthyrium microscopicum]